MIHNLQNKMSHTATVLEMSRLSPTVKQIVMRIYKPFIFLPGQWLEIVRKNSINTIDITGFSFIDSQYKNLLREEQQITLAIKESDHPVVQFMHHQLKIDDALQIQGLDGIFTFPPQSADLQQTRRVTLIGSGIGITPFISMIRTFLDYKVDYSKTMPNQFFDNIERFEFIYGVRNEEEFLFGQELIQTFETLSTLLSFAKLHVCFSKATSDTIKNFSLTTASYEPHFETRISQSLLEQVSCNGKEKHLFYLCGPTKLVNWSRDVLLQHQIPESCIQYEKW